MRDCEKRHEGEIRFAVEAALHWRQVLRGQTAHDRAIEVFSQLRVWDTERNNGVLLYLLLADHAVEIVADRGVHARVGNEGWRTICRPMEEAFRRGCYEDGVVAGIKAVGDALADHYPSTGSKRDELSDRPVVL